MTRYVCRKVVGFTGPDDTLRYRVTLAPLSPDPDGGGQATKVELVLSEEEANIYKPGLHYDEAFRSIPAAR